MLLDRQCAGLIKEMPTDQDDLMRAKVLSLRDEDAFLAYLEGLSVRAPEDVRDQAVELYGLK